MSAVPIRRLPLYGELPPSGPVPRDLVDAFQRRVSYLRVSLTDRCNYRCTYCMPEHGVDVIPRAAVASAAELTEIVRAFVALGVRRVRLTGGEPTLRADLVDVVARLGALPGLDDLSLTSNGERLLELAEPLRRAGLHRLNISIDSLDAERFHRITRRGNLTRVLAGAERAATLGFRAVKLNAVAVRGFNDDELGSLTEWAWQRNITPRFIEQMPMAGGELFVPGEFLPAAEIRAALAQGLGEPLSPDGAAGEHRGGGPARYYTTPSARGRLGIISAVTEQFCDDCNRVRLDAAGRLHACLAYDDATDLGAALRAGAGPDDLARAIAAGLVGKRRGHEFTIMGCGAPRKAMVSMGG